MGRRKANYICAQCGRSGFPAVTSTKYGIYQRIIHYDHKTRHKSSCYVDKTVEKRRIDNLRKRSDFKIHKDENLSVGELSTRTYMFYKDVGIDLYRLDEKIGRNHITDPFTIEMVNSLWKYLRLYVTGRLPSIIFKPGAFELLEYLKLEKKHAEILKKLPVKIRKEYQLLLKKGSLLDKNGHYRSISNYKLKERLRRPLKSVMFEIKFVEKHHYFSQIFRFRFLLNLAFEYWFIKYDLPKKLEKRKYLSERLSEGAFGSDKYRNQYSGLSQGM